MSSAISSEAGRRAAVVGSGPNGLSAAVVLAQAGYRVDVFEANSTPGGAARTLPLTLPGFHHDFGSSVHPLAAGSTFFQSLNLGEHGLEWIHSPVALAHPLDGGDAVCLHQHIWLMDDELGPNASGWRSLFEPFVRNWDVLGPEVLRPFTLLTRHPFLMARFGLSALPSAKTVAGWFLRDERARALYAGIAAHSVLSLDAPLSASIGLVLGIEGHRVGWPIPKGGAQAITDALISVLSAFGGEVHCNQRVTDLRELGDYDLKLCDITPRQLEAIAGNLLADDERKALLRYRYGPGVFKVDYALNAPIPWTSPKCALAATVHVGGTFEELLESEKAMSSGQMSDRPFVLVTQPSLFDSTRAPAGQHTAWAYCHVPHGSEPNCLGRLEAQIERFAAGFGECVLARKVFSPADLEHEDANLIGGDIGGGALDARQFAFRPTRRIYGTTAKDIFIASSSTPPGPGVHGLCGHHAAVAALKSVNT